MVAVDAIVVCIQSTPNFQSWTSQRGNKEQLPIARSFREISIDVERQSP
jgi:hypothetical protein